MKKNAQTSFTLKLSCHPSVKYKQSNEIRKILSAFLSDCGLKGEFSGHAGEAKRGSCHVKTITVARFSETGVLIYIKPKGNGSRCGIWITLPANFAGQSNNFFKLLREKAQAY
jgi:hypothetical protein